MKKHYIIPFKYYVEVEINTVPDFVIDKQAILQMGIDKFIKEINEFAKENIFKELAETMAPSRLTDIHEIDDID